MTFEEFVSTRKKVESLKDSNIDFWDTDDDEHCPGYIYEDSYWIEIYPNNTYHSHVAIEEVLTKNLRTAERWLYNRVQGL